MQAPERRPSAAVANRSPTSKGKHQIYVRCRAALGFLLARRRLTGSAKQRPSQFHLRGWWSAGPSGRGCNPEPPEVPKRGVSATQTSKISPYHPCGQRSRPWEDCKPRILKAKTRANKKKNKKKKKQIITPAASVGVRAVPAGIPGWKAGTTSGSAALAENPRTPVRKTNPPRKVDHEAKEPEVAVVCHGKVAMLALSPPLWGNWTDAKSLSQRNRGLDAHGHVLNGNTRKSTD